MATLPTPAPEQREAIMTVPTRHGSTATEFITVIHRKRTSTTKLTLRTGEASKLRQKPPKIIVIQLEEAGRKDSPVQSLRIQQRSPLSGLLAPEQPAGRRDTSRQNRRETKRGETMEVEERKRTKRDTDGKAEVRQQQGGRAREMEKRKQPSEGDISLSPAPTVTRPPPARPPASLSRRRQHPPCAWPAGGGGVGGGPRGA
ncbi:hypothetical protein SEVIR_9G162751v4 [Setaria viridis]